MIYVCTEFRANRCNVHEMALFKGRGQVILPRPSTKLIWHVQAWTVDTHVKFQADMTKDTEVKATFRRFGEALTRRLVGGTPFDDTSKFFIMEH